MSNWFTRCRGGTTSLSSVTRKFIIAPVASSYPMWDGIEVMNPLAAAELLAGV